jgi:uncharacterized membrane protein
MKKKATPSAAGTGRKTLFLAQFSLLLALEAILCFTPLGSLPALGPIVATVAHIPVIITAILLGTWAGTAMGAFTGLFSFIVWTFMTPPLSAPIAFVFTPIYAPGNFWSLVICFVPRILVGTVTGLSYRLFTHCFSKYRHHRALTYGLAGVLGSLTNTLLVVGGIALFFGDVYAGVVGQALILVAGSTILFSGIPEALLGGIAAYAICYPIKKYLLKTA